MEPRAWNWTGIPVVQTQNSTIKLTGHILQKIGSSDRIWTDKTPTSTADVTLHHGTIKSQADRLQIHLPVFQRGFDTQENFWAKQTLPFSFIYQKNWWCWQELNLHARKHCHLKATCLPFHHSTINYILFKFGCSHRNRTYSLAFKGRYAAFTSESNN